MLLFRYIFGFLIIRIRGDYCEQLLNIAAQNRVRLWSLRYKKNSIVGCISIKDFKKLRFIKRGINIRIKIIGKRGLPFYIARYNKRIGFLTGAIVFIAIIKFLSSFIWTINVEGINTVEASEIKNTCEKIGIYEGVRIGDIDTSNDAKRLTLASEKIAWASLNIEGSVLTVNVTEIKDNSDKSSATNIKALFDGKITKIDVTSGNVVVKVGDTVSKGDILVSGIVESLGGTAYVRSSGDIYASTTHTYTATEKFEKTKKVKTGKTVKQNTISFFGLKIPLYIGGVREDNVKITNISRLKIFGTEMPIFIAKNKFSIIKNKKIVYSKEELIEMLKNEINSKIKKDNITDFEIIDSSITENDDGITYTVTVQTVENIAIAENLLINTTN